MPWAEKDGRSCQKLGRRSGRCAPREALDRHKPYFYYYYSSLFPLLFFVIGSRPTRCADTVISLLDVPTVVRCPATPHGDARGGGLPDRQRGDLRGSLGASGGAPGRQRPPCRPNGRGLLRRCHEVLHPRRQIDSGRVQRRFSRSRTLARTSHPPARVLMFVRPLPSTHPTPSPCLPSPPVSSPTYVCP